MPTPRIIYRKLNTKKKAPYIVYSLIYDSDDYSIFSEESRPDSIS